MYTDFPHLEIKVKNMISEKYTGRRMPGIEDSLLNDVISHYIRLRFLLESPPRYRYELGQVIRLCLWGIASEKNNGDLYVLLANAYSLLDTCVQSSMTDHEYYARWSGAIIQHWTESHLRLCTTPENVKIGDLLYESILKQLTASPATDRSDTTSKLCEYRELYLIDSLLPSNYERIEHMLKSEPI